MLKESDLKDERTLRREQFASDFCWFMADPRGRRLMLRLLERLGMFRTTFNETEANPSLGMAFREGQKNIGYRLLSDMNDLCPNHYIEMLKEKSNA